MTVRRRYSIRTRNISENKILENLSHFNYLQCNISFAYYDNMKSRTKNVNKYVKLINWFICWSRKGNWN